MLAAALFDETIAQRLPLPLAQLYRAAANAKSPRDRHGTAYYLWEAGLKLLGSAAVVTYAAAPEHDPALAERLHNLARPAVGHWWEFVRLLVPRLADTDAGFAQVRELLFGKPRDDLPRAAGLDAALLEALQGKSTARSTVRLAELFDRLVAYRNQEFGHGAAGRKPDSHYERLGRALLLGVGELFGRLDVLAGRRLLYVAEVRRRGDGSWLVERADLSREMYQRVESLVLADGQLLPRPERLYLLERAASEAGTPVEPQLLHPLLAYDEEAAEVLFLNARRGAARVEYLSYTSGRRFDRADLAGEQRELLRRVLDMPAEAVHVEDWSARSAAEEPAGDSEAEAGAPRRLGEFDLLSKLGQGGMGVVYRARQPSLGREVALKCLFRSGDPKAEARFAREIHALGRVEHAHLVKIFGSGSEGEHWFYAMELIEGTTLADVCARLQASGSAVGELDLPTWHAAVSTACAEARRQEQPLSDAGGTSAAPASQAEPPAPAAPRGGRDYVRHIVELLRQVCAAAQALHEKGVIHRDIKPGNVMVTPEGGTAVLMDLGLAQVADEVEGRLTRTRQFVGTLRYASPEQVMSVARLDARGDVYSLGATLWELLALRPLFGATEQTPTPELMQRIQYEEPGRLRKANPAVPRDVAAIVEKCLQKDPRQRYDSARALGEELDRFLAGRPVKARPVTRLERGWKWARRRPALAALWSTLAVVIVAAFAVVTWQLGETTAALKRVEHEQRQRALAQINALRDAAPGAVPGILAELERSRADVLPRLRELWAEGGAEARRMRLALALAPVEPETVRAPLLAWMLKADDAAEVLLVRDALLPQQAKLRESLWALAEDAKTPAGQRLRALTALAVYDPESGRWDKAAEAAAELLLSANPFYQGVWAKALRPVRAALRARLAEVCRGEKLAEFRQTAALALADYAADEPDLVAEVFLDADPKQAVVLLPVLLAHREKAIERLRRTLALKVAKDAALAQRELLAKRQAMAGVALLHLGDDDSVWPWFRHTPDPEARSQLIWRVGLHGVDPLKLVQRLETEKDTSARRALIVALGEFSDKELPAALRLSITQKLLRWYRDDPDPGIHGAIDWLLRPGKEGPVARPLDWGQAKELQQIDEGLKRRDPDGKRRWYVNKEGQTMVLVPRPVKFRMGSPVEEPGRYDSERQHLRRIGRSYAIASKPVTVAQFQLFLKAYPKVYQPVTKDHAPDTDCPIIAVSWYMAAQYCNWLSAQEGIPKEEWCYLKHADIKTGMKPYPDYLKRKGYRLPTEAEWEYACRARASTSRYYGSSIGLLPRYAWYLQNSQDREGKNRSWPVGQKRPNDLGLFDMHGNVWTWVEDEWGNYPQGGGPIEDKEDKRDREDRYGRVLRGGSFNDRPLYIRSACRYSNRPDFLSNAVGLRVARTYD